MGSKHFTALFVLAACLGVTGPALAYNVVQAEPLVVPANTPTDAADPNIVAQSTAGSVTFAGDQTVPAGFLQATAAAEITFGGVTTASGAILATTTANGAILASGALIAGGAVTLEAGTGAVTVGALSLGAPSAITGGQVTLSGPLTVPASTAVAQLAITAATAPTATITLNLGPTADALAAGTRIRVFTWTGPHTVTATLGTAPTLGAGLKYDLTDLAVGGDVLVIAACGDRTIDVGETCDDGNVVAGDGCSATCTTEPVVVDAGSDAGDAGDAAADAGVDAAADAGDAGPDAGTPDATADGGDGALPSGSASGSALPALGDIFSNDGSSSCASTPGGAHLAARCPTPPPPPRRCWRSPPSSCEGGDADAGAGAHREDFSSFEAVVYGWIVGSTRRLSFVRSRVLALGVLLSLLAVASGAAALTISNPGGNVRVPANTSGDPNLVVTAGGTTTFAGRVDADSLVVSSVGAITATAGEVSAVQATFLTTGASITLGFPLNSIDRATLDTSNNTGAVADILFNQQQGIILDLLRGRAVRVATTGGSITVTTRIRATGALTLQTTDGAITVTGDTSIGAGSALTARGRGHDRRHARRARGPHRLRARDHGHERRRERHPRRRRPRLRPDDRDAPPCLLLASAGPHRERAGGRSPRSRPT